MQLLSGYLGDEPRDASGTGFEDMKDTHWFLDLPQSSTTVVLTDL